jgi:ABC-type multidrug transport system permease subunit
MFSNECCFGIIPNELLKPSPTAHGLREAHLLTLYAQRLIVEKHSRYVLYYPSCEAVASMLTDLPYKICNAMTFNLTLYFIVNLN